MESSLEQISLLFVLIVENVPHSARFMKALMLFHTQTICFYRARNEALLLLYFASNWKQTVLHVKICLISMRRTLSYIIWLKSISSITFIPPPLQLFKLDSQPPAVIFQEAVATF